MAYRSVKKKNFGHAYHIADTRRLAQAWKQWTAQIQGIRDKQDMQQVALQHWADVLVHKVMICWGIFNFKTEGFIFIISI